jgi:hypothetical protein
MLEEIVWFKPVTYAGAVYDPAMRVVFLVYETTCSLLARHRISGVLLKVS